MDRVAEERKVKLVAEEVGANMRGKHRQVAARAGKPLNPANPEARYGADRAHIYCTNYSLESRAA